MYECPESKSEVELKLEVFALLCNGKRPDPSLIEGGDDTVIALQDWACQNVALDWMTGLSVLEAVDLIIYGAIENGNIKEIE